MGRWRPCAVRGFVTASKYDCAVQVVALPRPDGPDWLALTTDLLPVAEALEWAVDPGCGAVVAFAGTVRDHAEGRPGVICLEYEAYEEHAGPRLAAVAVGARVRWPALGRVALWHRVGPLAVTDVAVVVVASAPHRGEAFDAARWCIDSVKSTVPIWKKETWAEGSDWGTGAHTVGSVT